jgi:hypothetical protein
MNTWAQRLKLWNWIASAALLFAAIAPALSQAVVSPNPSLVDMAMVCTSTGMQSVASLDAGSEAPVNATNATCAFCLLHAQLACGLPTPELPAWKALTSVPPDLFQVSQPLPSAPWSPGLARAPPTLL